MPISIIKNPETNNSFGNFYIDNKEKRRVEIDTLHLISYGLQRSDKNLIRFKK